MDNTTSKTTIYLDPYCQDGGLAFRTTTTTTSDECIYPETHEESGAVEGIAGEAAQAIIDGEVPSQSGLDDLRDAYGSDVVLDGVGEIFPGWDQ